MGAERLVTAFSPTRARCIHRVRYFISNVMSDEEMVRWQDAHGWLQSNVAGCCTGIYHTFDHDNDATIIFSFSDPDTAFWFKMHWG